MALRKCIILDHGPGLHRQTMLGWIDELESVVAELTDAIRRADQLVVGSEQHDDAIEDVFMLVDP
jgi:hypothetical protein